MVNDRRTRHTEERIEQAMITCLADTSPDKVTVVQICRVAGINRGTFYAHYTDPIALYHHIGRKLMKHMEKISLDIQNKKVSYMDGIVSFLENVQSNKRAFLALYQAKNQAIIQILKDILIEIFVSENDKSIGEMKYAIEFYVNGAMSITARWVLENCPKSIDEMAKLIHFLLFRK